MANLVYSNGTFTKSIAVINGSEDTPINKPYIKVSSYGCIPLQSTAVGDSPLKVNVNGTVFAPEKTTISTQKTTITHTFEYDEFVLGNTQTSSVTLVMQDRYISVKGKFSTKYSNAGTYYSQTYTHSACGDTLFTEVGAFGSEGYTDKYNWTTIDGNDGWQHMGCRVNNSTNTMINTKYRRSGGLFLVNGSSVYKPVPVRRYTATTDSLMIVSDSVSTNSGSSSTSKVNTSGWTHSTTATSGANVTYTYTYTQGAYKQDGYLYINGSQGKYSRIIDRYDNLVRVLNTTRRVAQSVENTSYSYSMTYMTLYSRSQVDTTTFTGYNISADYEYIETHDISLATNSTNWLPSAYLGGTVTKVSVPFNSYVSFDYTGSFGIYDSHGVVTTYNTVTQFNDAYVYNAQIESLGYGVDWNLITLRLNNQPQININQLERESTRIATLVPLTTVATTAPTTMFRYHGSTLVLIHDTILSAMPDRNGAMCSVSISNITSKYLKTTIYSNMGIRFNTHIKTYTSQGQTTYTAKTTYVRYIS